MKLTNANRKQVKLRLNISGPSGAGKTYSALLLAKGIAGEWGNIAVIDTENGSASLYSHLGDFKTIELTPPFSPERYIQAIDMCVDAGISVIIIDSTSHEWNCLLEENERLASAKFRGNTWSAWSETTPRHDRFVQHVLHCNAHVITCTRSKTETVMGDDKKVKKVGMKDVQRDGWEYELTVSLNLDRDSHLAYPSKDRTNIFEGMQPFLISDKTGATILKWCETGALPVIEIDPATADALSSLALATDLEQLSDWKKSIPADVIKRPEVTKAAKARYTDLKDKEAANG